ncbi:hypothetical protein FQR65_LT11442 [Abscondita terminalis]|nr:hypothetical protein FQR65_LT11442 [Abscondita terminalis]
MSMRILSEALQTKAVLELHEDVQRRNEDIQLIRTWLKQQPHLNVNPDDQWILTFLRGCKFSLQKTKQKLDMFYTMKSLVPEFYKDRDPFRPEIQQILKLGCVLPLPKSDDPIAPRTVLIRMLEKTTKFQVVDGLKLILMIFEILMNEDDNFIIVGGQVLEDYKELSFKHIQMSTPSVIKQAITCLLLTYPLRSKSFHVINASDWFNSAFQLVKPFVSKKIFDRMHVYKNCELDKLKKFIPSSLLPREYGGNGPSVNELTDEWKMKVESYKEWFKEDYMYRSDESKRIEPCLLYDNLFGAEVTVSLLKKSASEIVYIMVVSNKSAFQFKLQFFESISQDNLYNSSANSSRRNTIELKPITHGNEKIKTDLNNNSLTNLQRSLSVRDTLNNVREQFSALSKSDIENKIESTAEKKKITGVIRSQIMDEVIDDLEDHFSFEKTNKTNFNVMIKGSFCHNPYISLYPCMDDRDYDSDDDEFYCYDFFDY